MKTLDTLALVPAIASLVSKLPLAPLGPGKPHEEMRAAIEAALTAIPRSGDANMAAACRAGLWLAFDFLDESHSISQDLGTAEGSYWHALMHRREPDYWNSKYWWRRVGKHPIFAELATAAAELGYPGRKDGWDPEAFVDACEAHCGKKDADEELLRRVQRAEWELLFKWCWEGR